MCRISDVDLENCLLCLTQGVQKCTHEVAVCHNTAVHQWKVYYYKNSGGISTFQGCGFCKYANSANLPGPAYSISDNPGWPGCCFPPQLKQYHRVPPEDWPFVASYHRMPIPEVVQNALNNMKAMSPKKAVSDKLSINTQSSRTIQQPVPIPKSNGYMGASPRSYSPSAIHISPAEGASPRSSMSSRDSNSSGSPASSRRGTLESGTSPINGRSRSSSQDDPRMAILSTSSQSRRNGSPVDRLARGDPAGASGKRRSNSDPKHQPPPPSAYERQTHREKDVQYVVKGRESPTPSRGSFERERDSPTQQRYRAGSASSTTSSNHPYMNPHSPASSSMKRLNQPESITTPTPRPPMPAPVPRARHNDGPSIASVMNNMSLNPAPTGLHAAGYNAADATAATLARLQQLELKRGVIPPHVRKAGSVVSAGSSSSSSTNSSAREGTVVSDGAFTDYISDDSDFDLQRQAEVEAEVAYQEALKKHEEMEFRDARESLARQHDSYPPPAPMGYSRRPPVGYTASSRIRV